MKTLTNYSLALRTLESRLRDFEHNIPKYLENAVKEKEEVIVKAVQNQLYIRGVNSRGTKIKSYAPYTATTVRIKKQKHQPTNRVTLRDTGSFYELMRVIYEPDGIRITSDDLKTDALIDKYGPEILGLTEDSLTRILTVHIRRSLAKQMRQAIRVAKIRAQYEKKHGKVNVYKSKYAED
jgi:hypothetical protein